MKRLASTIIIALTGVFSCNSPAPAQENNTIRRWANSEYMAFSNDCYDFLRYSDQEKSEVILKPWEIRQLCNCSADAFEQIYTFEEIQEYMYNPSQDFLNLSYTIGNQCSTTILKSRKE